MPMFIAFNTRIITRTPSGPCEAGSVNCAHAPSTNKCACLFDSANQVEPTWLESERLCRVSQGQLVKVTDDVMLALKQILLVSGNFWTGLTSEQLYNYFGKASVQSCLL